MELNVSSDVTLFFVLTYFASQCTIINTSNETQMNTSKVQPDLGCILFDDAGCQISCNVMCNLYGCQSNAKCIRQMYCDCNEIYEISSTPATINDYRSLSFNKLWNYKFDKSKYADKVRQKIIQNPETFDVVLALLRNPHKTGIDIKKRLQQINPKWPRVRKLKPKRLGYINDLLNEAQGFDGASFDEYLETNMKPLIKKMYDRLQKAKYKSRLATILDEINEEEELKYIIKQILLSRQDSLYDYASNYLHKKGLEVDDLVVDDDISSITVHDTDQIILAGVLQKLLEVKENPRKSYALDDTIADNEDSYDSDYCSSENDPKALTSSDEMTTANDDVYDSDFYTSEEDENTFALSDEMTTANDDLYDADFDTMGDDENAFTLSDEMTTTRDDLYDPEFDQAALSVISKKRKRKNKGKRDRKKRTRDSDTANRMNCKGCPTTYTNNRKYESMDIPYDSNSDSYSNDGWWSNGYTGSVQSWNLGSSGVRLENRPGGGTRMQWKLGKSGITLADDGRGNARQSWNLGNSGVYLQ